MLERSALAIAIKVLARHFCRYKNTQTNIGFNDKNCVRCNQPGGKRYRRFALVEEWLVESICKELFGLVNLFIEQQEQALSSENIFLTELEEHATYIVHDWMEKTRRMQNGRKVCARDADYLIQQYVLQSGSGLSHFAPTGEKYFELLRKIEKNVNDENVLQNTDVSQSQITTTIEMLPILTGDDVLSNLDLPFDIDMDLFIS